MQLPKLRVSFESAAAFRREYEQNLVNGGVFVPTSMSLELRQTVAIELVMTESDLRVELPGEVVHILTTALSGVGGTPGVAVQFAGASHEVRARLEPLASATNTFQRRPADPGRRRAPRTRARVGVRITDFETRESIDGHSRDLSRDGALVAVEGSGVIAVGRSVEIQLEHPISTEVIDVPGIVVRHLCGEHGETVAMGVQFRPSRDRDQDVDRFLDDVQSAAHARRLGGISGPISELGVDGLIQTFGRSAAGTLTLRRGVDEAIVVFEKGLLRHAQLGSASGVKALMRMLAWTDGSFEFFARVDPVIEPEAPLPVEAALLEAVHHLDEVGRIDVSQFPMSARLCITEGAQNSQVDDAHAKIEDAVLDLARAGSFTIRRVIDLIPEPDSQIYQTLQRLMDGGVVHLDL